MVRVEDYLVQQEGLACAVDTCDRNHGHFALERVEKCECLRVYFVFWVIEKDTFLVVAEDEGNGFLLECLHGESVCHSVNYLNFKFF